MWKGGTVWSGGSGPSENLAKGSSGFLGVGPGLASTSPSCVRSRRQEVFCRVLSGGFGGPGLVLTSLPVATLLFHSESGQTAVLEGM